MAAEIKPAYLISGDDEAKLTSSLARIRSRASSEGGAVETFAPEGSGAPDIEALVGALPTLSLTEGRRYLVADRVERCAAGQIDSLVGALSDPPPDATVVLIARTDGAADRRTRERRKKLLERLSEGVSRAGGETLRFEAPRGRDLPARLVGGARSRGFELEPEAARLLVDRMGESTQRLEHELDRLALWAGEGGRVGEDDLHEMVADTSEEASWALSDALLDGDRVTALAAAERLSAQGEPVTALVYAAARRLREAQAALALLEQGRPAQEVQRSLRMHPWAARKLVERLRHSSEGDVRAAACAVADLEWWTRGGSGYPDRVALTLAVRRATGASR